MSWLAAAVGFGALTSLAGGIMGTKSAKSQAQKNADYQREFAQHGIRWAVEDAKQAGIHPLAALGAQGKSFQPVYVDQKMDYGLSNMGQNVQRAASAFKSVDEKKLESLGVQMAEQELMKKKLEVMGLRSDILRQNSLPASPGADFYGRNVIPGQTNSNVIVDPVHMPASGYPGVKAGQVATEQPFTLPDGSIIFGVTQEASEPMESSPPTMVDYSVWKLSQGWGNIKGEYENTPSEQMIKQRNYLNSVDPPGRGYKWLLDAGRWKKIEVPDNWKSIYAPSKIVSRRNYGKKGKKGKLKKYDWKTFSGF